MEAFRDWYGFTVMGGDLTDLSLNFNGLAGTIPPEIDNLTNLTWLYLNGNELTEKRPQGLVGATEMLNLHFHTNAVLCPPQTKSSKDGLTALNIE